jgi:hypothetical protein
MNRRNRVLTALLTLVALLFSQLAVAAYSCPMSSAPQAAVAGEAPLDQDASDSPSLCHGHCKYGSASFESAKFSAWSPQAVDSGLRVPALRVLTLRTQPISRPRALAVSPPPLSRFTVLRI